ncbi:MAG: NAD(P)H-dependent oxidoreductase [Ignavibacteriaceae bacterium]|nr:NAD(P)H-dependent oxidoreductase [Ignavibacteriaceae bacterium]
MIFAINGSNSEWSINKKLLKSVIKHSEVNANLLEIESLDIPIYSIQRQQKHGFPQEILELNESLNNASGFIISTPEHNGFFTAFFKNLIDWLSRLDRKVFRDKFVVILSTSPGKMGGKTAAISLSTLVNRMGGRVISVHSLPSFKENYDESTGEILNGEFLSEVKHAVKQMELDIKTEKSKELELVV